MSGVDIWQSSLQTGFRTGPWTVKPQQCSLEGDGDTQHLEPKVMEVLVYLAAHVGKVVRRDRLIEDVWRTVVNDEVLSRAISLLRSHLNDDPKAPSYIQTIPKLGYRFIADVLPLTGDADASVDRGGELPPDPTRGPEPEPAPSIAQPRPEPSVSAEAAAPAAMPRGRRLWIGPVAALLLTGLLVLAWRPDAPQTAPVGEFTPPTDLPVWFDKLLLGGADPKEVTAIAVLPFENLSEDSKLGYLGDIITDEVIMALSKVRGLHVVARRSTTALRNKQQDVRWIGNYLNVDVVLEGTVKRYGDRLRVSAHLSNVDSGYVIWAGTYDEPLGDAYKLQMRFTRVVTDALREATSKDLRAPTASSELPSLDSYQSFLYGRYLLKLRGEKALRGSIESFEKALEDTPDYHDARLGLARALALLPHYSREPEAAMYARALAELDGMTLVDDAEQGAAESIRGFIADRSWEWAAAEQHHLRALELNPEDPNAYVWYSQHLSMVGRLRDAVDAARRGKDLDSVSPVVNDRVAVSHLWVNDEVRAAEYFAIGAELGFTHSLHPGYLIFLHREGRFEEARRLFSRILELSGRNSDWVNPMYRWLMTGSKREEAVAAVERAVATGNMPPRFEFGIWVLLGEVDRVYATIERYEAERRNLDLEFLFSAECAPVRADPRFGALASRLGLANYWRDIRKADISLSTAS